MKNNASGKSYTVEEAQNKLMHFCAYRDRSHKEVEEKLLAMRMIPQAREKIILKLMQDGFLNEERFARSFVRGKFRMNKWGRIKIRQELKLRGISAPLVQIAMTEIVEDEYLQTLHELAQKKWAQLGALDLRKKRERLASHLLSKGFEPGLVYELIQDFRK